MFLQERVAEVNEKIKELKNASNIVIWGAGVHTEKLFEKSELLSYKIREIVDVDERKENQKFFGFVVKKPDNVVWEIVDAVVISAPSYEKEISERLKSKSGYSGIIITFYGEDECIPFYLLPDDNIQRICYSGDYKEWNDAAAACEGYDDETIMNKVIDANKKVLNGEAVWERDGCLFYQVRYVYSICAFILRCAVKNRNMGVRVLDIGGSLGSTYLQNRKFLEDVNNLEWVIAEQDHFADYGHKNLESVLGGIKFVRSTDCWELRDFDIILMSGSLQYIADYKEVISKIRKAHPNYIILDRIMISAKQRICKQSIPKGIYQSSYPVRIFGEGEMRELFGENYEMIDNDISSVPAKVYFSNAMAESRRYVYRCQKG